MGSWSHTWRALCFLAFQVAFLPLLLTLGLSPHLAAQTPDSAGGTQAGPSEERQAERQADRREQGATNSPLLFRIIEDPEETQRTQQREQRTEQRETENLALQQRSALAAEKAAAAAESQEFAARWQVVLTFAGTVALLYTLLLNRRSLRISAQAAQAATDAIAVERAWMVHEGFVVRPENHITVDGKRYQKGFICCLNWRNAGRSPALNAKLYREQKLLHPGDQMPTFCPPAEPIDGNAVVGPGVAIQSNYEAISHEDMIKIANGDLRWIYYCRRTYSTTSNPGKTHFSEACLQVQFEGFHLVNGKDIPRVGVAPVGSQNTAN